MTRHLTLIAALTSALTLAACDTGNEEPTAADNASTSAAQSSSDTSSNDSSSATTNTVDPSATDNSPTESDQGHNAAQQDTNAEDAQALDDTATLSLDGTLSAPEGISLPAQGEVRVRLIDVTLEDGSTTLLAEQSFDTAQTALPLPFSLKMPSEALKDDHRQVLQAEVIGVDGQVRWATAEPEALALNADAEPAPVALMLEAVETAPDEELEEGETAVSPEDQQTDSNAEGVAEQA